MQRRALFIISPGVSYSGTLKDRRQELCPKLFEFVISNFSQKFDHLLPARPTPHYNLRRRRTFIFPTCRAALAYVLCISGWSEKGGLLNGDLLNDLKQRYFCAVYNHAAKADPGKGYWNPKGKLGVTTLFSEIIKL